MESSERCFWVQWLSSVECAAWVQAWGSILAILAAIGIAVGGHFLGNWRDRKRLLEMNRDRLSVVHAAINQLQVAAQEWIDDLGVFEQMVSGTKEKARSDTFENARALIVGIPLLEIPDARTAIDVISLRHICRAVDLSRSVRKNVYSDLQTVVNSCIGAKQRIDESNRK